MREHIIDALIRLPEWDLVAAQLGERANYQCEYCGLRLLDSVHNYKLWEKDHIIPVHAGGTDTLENLALACGICNSKLKNRWNPRARTQSTDRAELILIVRQYIEEKRQENEIVLQHVRQVIFGKAVGQAASGD